MVIEYESQSIFSFENSNSVGEYVTTHSEYDIIICSVNYSFVLITTVRVNAIAAIFKSYSK
jgi:hypothetical protein